MSQPNTSCGPLLTHTVYFTLYDQSDEARNRLVQACRKYLAAHPGVLYFACGLREPELHRDVNDIDFDVSLHMLFRDRASHDQYQVAPEHQQFIAENKHNWRKVRVFDTLLVPEPASERGT